MYLSTSLSILPIVVALLVARVAPAFGTVATAGLSMWTLTGRTMSDEHAQANQIFFPFGAPTSFQQGWYWHTWHARAANCASVCARCAAPGQCGRQS